MDSAVTKMVIEVYKDNTYKEKKSQYPVLFNPENYTLQWEFSFSNDEKANGGSAPCLLKSVNRSIFDMTFIIDGTGIGAAALGRDKIVVANEIWNFMEATTVLNRNGTRKTEPPYCRLVWGNLCTRCFVRQVKVEIKLLDRQGIMLRAALSTTFQTVYPL